MYCLTRKNIILEGKEYTVYGIRYSDEIFAEDVSADIAKVTQLVADFNRYSLEPIHFYDAIEDFLSE